MGDVLPPYPLPWGGVRHHYVIRTSRIHWSPSPRAHDSSSAATQSALDRLQLQPQTALVHLLLFLFYNRRTHSCRKQLPWHD
jgi:hypothetical protein